MEKLIKDFFAKWGLGDKEKRRLPLLLGMLGLGVFLLAVSSRPLPRAAEEQTAWDGGDLAAEGAEQAPPRAEEELEQKLAAVLSRIKGAGEVAVSLTFAQSGRTEYAVNASTTLRTTEEEDEAGGSRSTTEQTRTDTLVLAEKEGRPLAVQSLMPEVQGVLVVAEGGNSPTVCREISAALQNLLGIAAHKIVVCPMQ